MADHGEQLRDRGLSGASNLPRVGVVPRGEFLPLSRPSVGESEVAAVIECLRSGWITSGPRVAEFERAFAAHVGARHAVAVSSATAGLHLALLAADVQPGDEVITSPMTWASTGNMLLAVGAR